MRFANVLSRLFKSARKKKYKVCIGIDFLSMVLKWMCFRVLSATDRFSNGKWAEIKYLGAIQNRRRQLFCRGDNAFSQYTSAFAACRLEFERLKLYIKKTVECLAKEIYKFLRGLSLPIMNDILEETSVALEISSHFTPLTKKTVTSGTQICNVIPDDIKNTLSLKREIKKWKVETFSCRKMSIWINVFKNGSSKICGGQPLKNLRWYGLLRQIIWLEFV